MMSAVRHACYHSPAYSCSLMPDGFSRNAAVAHNSSSLRSLHAGAPVILIPCLTIHRARGLACRPRRDLPVRWTSTSPSPRVSALSRENPGGGPGFSGIDDRAGGFAIDRLMPSKQWRDAIGHPPRTISRNCHIRCSSRMPGRSGASGLRNVAGGRFCSNVPKSRTVAAGR